MQMKWLFNQAGDGNDDADGHSYLLTFPLPLLRSDERNSHDFVLWSVSTVAASKKPSYSKHFEASDIGIWPNLAEPRHLNVRSVQQHWILPALLNPSSKPTT